MSQNPAIPPPGCGVQGWLQLFTLLCLLHLTPLSAFAGAYTAFKDGEHFKFSVAWGPFAKAGEITIDAHREVREGRAIFRIVMQTSSKGLVGGLYPWEDTATAWIDEESGRLIEATELAHNGKRSIDSLTRFDYGTRLASHRDKARPGRNVDIPIPEGSPVDLLSALMEARSWAADAGESRQALIFAGRDLYPVTIEATQVETLRYQGKRLETRILEPRMESGQEKGIFKRGGEIRIWIGNEAPHLPVRLQLKLKFGTARLNLKEHSIERSDAAL